MSNITLQDAQAWATKSKLNLGALESALEGQTTTQVFARIAASYDTSSWTDETTTPDIVKSIIAMEYVAFIYRRTYSEETDGPTYADMLMGMAKSLIDGIIDGSITIIGDSDETISNAEVYPDDTSSALDPTTDDPSLGPNAFSMSTIW